MRERESSRGRREEDDEWATRAKESTVNSNTVARVKVRESERDSMRGRQEQEREHKRTKRARARA